MPSDSEVSRPHLAWRIQPAVVAVEHLQQSRGAELQLSQATEQVAVLYIYGPRKAPLALTWSDYCGPDEDPHLLRETQETNQFDKWLALNPAADVWALATAWHFYEAWLAGNDYPHWQSRLQKTFPSNALLDQLLQVSGGWLLWRFQVNLLCKVACADRKQAKYAATAWTLQSPDDLPFPPELLLPDGSNLRDALCERSFRARSGEIGVFADPDLRLAATLHTLTQTFDRTDQML